MLGPEDAAQQEAGSEEEKPGLSGVLALQHKSIQTVQSFITLECVASAWEYLLSSEGDVGMGVVEDSLSSR